jgi:hypothetical protein
MLIVADDIAMKNDHTFGKTIKIANLFLAVTDVTDGVRFR